MKNRTSEEKLDTIHPHLLKRNSSQAVRPHKAHRNSKGQMVRRRRSITRGFLRKCQPPACQGNPVAITDRSGRTQCQAKKTGNIEKLPRRQTWAQQGKTAEFSATFGGKRQWCLGSFEHIVPSHAWQNDIKASVNIAWQISPFCHILLVGAFVLDGTND